MHQSTTTDATTSRRSRGVIVAIVAAAMGLVLTLGTGTASAQGFVIETPGHLGAEVGNRFCYNFQTTGESAQENVSYSVGAVTLDGNPVALPGWLLPRSHVFGAVDGETRWGFAGTPTTAGTFTVEITATDDNGTPAADDDLISDPVDFTIDVGTEAAADVVIHAGRLGAGYTIDCESQGREVQGFLRDLDNFGAAGNVGSRLSRLAIRNHTPFDATTNTGEPMTAAALASVDILLDGWVWGGTFTPEEIRDIGTWVNGGGVLIAAEDRDVADTLGQMFGAPTSSDFTLCTHTPSETGDPQGACPLMSAADATHPIVAGAGAGAFGDWSGETLATSGSVGHFGAAPPAGWTEVVQWNSNANAAVITRDVGLGRVILLNDEGLMRTQSFPDSANATFVGNLIAYAIDEIGDGPNPQPVLADDSYTVVGGQAFTLNPCTNDPDDGPAGNATVFVDTPLPAGVTFTPATCTLAGTATEGFSFAYQRTAGGITAWAVVEVDVNLVPDLRDDTFTGTVGVAFDQGVCANDVSLGDAPRTTTISSGSLPPGLSLNQCRVQGTPTQAGSFTARYRVTDADGDTATARVDITIAEAESPPPSPTFRCKGQVATIVGTAGNDTLVGTAGPDVIVGLGGNDTIRGGGGDDLICAGGGDDTVVGGAGNDRVLGQGGNDLLRGGAGADQLVGGPGDDRLAGQGGAPDRCIGGAGVDRFLNGCEIRRQ